MTRRAARVDANQRDIVAALRDVGASVTHTHGVGQGFPDLVVGFAGRTYCFEVKDGSLAPSARALTPPQQRWHAEWQGHAEVITSPDQALAALGITMKESEK